MQFGEYCAGEVTDDVLMESKHRMMHHAGIRFVTEAEPVKQEAGSSDSIRINTCLLFI